MALVEAMSWGLPVVTTGVGGAGEFLDEGRNCMLVTPGDIHGISNAISELARNPALRQRLGHAARETISQFSIDSYIVKLNEMYEELASGLPQGRTAVDSATKSDHEALVPIGSHAPDHATPLQVNQANSR